MLELFGTLTGVGAVTTVAGFWKRHKWAKGFANLVASFQVGRQALKDGNHDAALAVVDKVLDKEELEKTIAMVKEIKLALAKKEAIEAAEANAS